ncbi:MAG: molecular chaperone DnaJ [bacterium]|nr:molecular chaperone DnaJ [bacterium]
MEPKTKHFQTPEELELETKKAELTELENQLADQELVLASLEAELSAFQKEYYRLVVTKFWELDELEALIAEAEVRANPKSKSATTKAEETRAKAEETRKNIADAPPPPDETPAFKPSDKLKQMYRDAAKTLHPDLTTDEAERERRTRAMAEANQAYADGDEERLEAILRDWQSSPDAVPGEGIAAELVRAIRKAAQVRQRMIVIQQAIEALRTTDLFKLLEAAIAAKERGEFLLEEMSNHLTTRIDATQKRYKSIISKVKE